MLDDALDDDGPPAAGGCVSGLALIVVLGAALAVILGSIWVAFL